MWKKDIINFQNDPLACAIVSGWQESVEIEAVPLKLEIRESWLYEIPIAGGFPHAWSQKLMATPLMSFGVISSVSRDKPLLPLYILFNRAW